MHEDQWAERDELRLLREIRDLLVAIAAELQPQSAPIESLSIQLGTPIPQ